MVIFYNLTDINVEVGKKKGDGWANLTITLLDERDEGKQELPSHLF